MCFLRILFCLSLWFFEASGEAGPPGPPPETGGSAVPGKAVPSTSAPGTDGSASPGKAVPSTSAPGTDGSAVPGKAVPSTSAPGTDGSASPGKAVPSAPLPETGGSVSPGKAVSSAPLPETGGSVSPGKAVSSAPLPGTGGSAVSGEGGVENSTENRRGNLYFYNKGIQLLKEGKEASARPFLQKSFYQYLFFPAYQTLVRLERPPVLWPFLWHIAAVLYGLFSLAWLIFLLKKAAAVPPLFLLKGVIFWFSGLAVLALLGFFSLQKRAGTLAEIKGHSAPFAESSVLWTAPEGSDIKILKTGRGWVQAQTDTGQKGWVRTKNLLFTLE